MGDCVAVSTIFNAIRYVARTGGQWRFLLRDLPPWWVVYKQMPALDSGELLSVAGRGCAVAAARMGRTRLTLRGTAGRSLSLRFIRRTGWSYSAMRFSLSSSRSWYLICTLQQLGMEGIHSLTSGNWRLRGRTSCAGYVVDHAYHNLRAWKESLAP